jgi:hypothetical protein
VVGLEASILNECGNRQ